MIIATFRHSYLYFQVLVLYIARATLSSAPLGFGDILVDSQLIE
jgi:hypothetical protein